MTFLEKIEKERFLKKERVLFITFCEEKINKS